MSSAPRIRPQDGGHYEISVRGHLSPQWDAWFEDFTLMRRSDGITVLHGCDVDQAALHGVLRKLADLGLPLVSVTSSSTARS